jgi:DNA-directed RNA polymerase specialized sigma24 family protein
MTNDISNDTELMARLAKGDMSALGDIVRKHQDKILSLSYRVLGDWHRAEDF